VVQVFTAIVVALLVIFVIVVIAGLVLRGRRSRQAQGGDWTTRALDACAAADVLHDRLEARLSLTQSGAGEEGTPPDRWSDTERSMDQLATKLHALRFAAPDYTTDQATEELIMALSALRAALQVEHGARAVSSARAGELVSTAQARLMELDAAIRALRAAI
jgi:hypothetical protein